MCLIGQHNDFLGGIQHREVDVLAFLKLLHHRRHQIRTVFGQQRFQLRDRTGVIYRLALGPFKLCSQLLIKLSAVGNKYQLVITQCRIAPDLDRQHHHGQRFPRTLRMPNDAALVLFGSAMLEAINGLMHRAKLLITRNLLEHAAINRLIDREVANQVKQVGAAENTGQQNLLRTGNDWCRQRRRQHGRIWRTQIGRAKVTSRWRGGRQYLRLIQGPGIFPFQIMLNLGTDGANPCLIPMRAHHQLVVIKQPLGPFMFMRCAPVGIAPQLVDALFHRIGNIRRLGLDHGQRQAIDEQHNIGDDRFVDTLDAELIHAQKFIVAENIEIDHLHRLPATAMPQILLHRLVMHQHLPQTQIGFHQGGSSRMNDVAHDLAQVVVTEPRVDPQQRRLQTLFEHDFTERLALTVVREKGWRQFCTIDPRPAQLLQLHERG